MSIGDRKRRELVADVFEGKFEAIGDARRVVDCIEAIGKKSAHFGVALQMSFRVLAQELARRIEMGVFADAGEDVEDLPADRARVPHPIGRDDRQATLFRQIAEGLIDPIFAAQEMALNLDADVVATEDVDKRLRALPRRAINPSANCGSSFH